MPHLAFGTPDAGVTGASSGRRRARGQGSVGRAPPGGKLPGAAPRPAAVPHGPGASARRASRRTAAAAAARAREVLVKRIHSVAQSETHLRCSRWVAIKVECHLKQFDEVPFTRDFGAQQFIIFA